jgi:hypothetical protein
MNINFTSRTISRVLAVLVAVAAIVALSAFGGSSDVTRARLERSLPQTFSNLYVRQAALLGHKGITVQSLKAKAQCDKGGPKVADHGPGADWICQMYFNDPAVPLPDGSAKFELNVHSNDCYTAGGPSKFVGLLTITDTHGRTSPTRSSSSTAALTPAAPTRRPASTSRRPRRLPPGHRPPRPRARRR